MRKEKPMTLGSWRASALPALAVGLALAIAGCNSGDTGKPVRSSEKGDKGERAHNYKDRDWCAEHGVPESLCAECNPKLAAAFKKKSDWCNEHDRPKSQCFKCDPKLKEKFAQEYRDKYGEDPPPTEDEGKERKDDKR
jgi:hypothetical protein